MLKIFYFTILILISSIVSAEVSQPKAEVMLMGVFHFANPQMDMVKSKQINVMTPLNQRYLDLLSDEIATFRPTIILLEFNPDDEEKINAQYRNYLQNNFVLPSNEIYQLGFRIAQKSQLSKIYSFDEQTIGWDAEPMFKYLKDNDPATMARLEKTIANISSEQKIAHANSSLQKLLLDANNPVTDISNKALYLLTNQVGAGANFEGADAAASWWHRNFRMYANIQHLAKPGERVLVIGGQGHIAILKDLLSVDQDRAAISVNSYLNKKINGSK